jgi:hypothetical protein
VTDTYDDYRRALTELRELPTLAAADLDHSRQTHVRADALADEAISAADTAGSGTLRAIEAQLAASRLALQPLGRSNLIPPRIRPSGGARTANRDDILEAQRCLAGAVNRLRQAAQAELGRTEAENGRLARESAERERLAREAAERVAAAASHRKRLLGFGVAAALLLIVLIVIVAVSL